MRVATTGIDLGNFKTSIAFQHKGLESRAFFVSVFDALKKGRRVTIGGFGTFMVSKRAERNGRNPRTGKAIRIPATRVPRFKSSRSLKSAVL